MRALLINLVILVFTVWLLFTAPYLIIIPTIIMIGWYLWYKHNQAKKDRLKTFDDMIVDITYDIAYDCFQSNDPAKLRALYEQVAYLDLESSVSMVRSFINNSFTIHTEHSVALYKELAVVILNTAFLHVKLNRMEVESAIDKILKFYIDNPETYREIIK